MKVLLSWLKEFAPIEGDPAAIGEQLSDLGLAVESMDRVGEGIDGVVVAKVLDLRPHPDADRIQLVDVDAGDGEPLQIACGAFNMEIGDLVPLASLGTTMPSGMKIERRKMRGEWSNGMLCAPEELGMGDDHAGIMVLGASADTKLTPGTDFGTALGIEPDVLYDLEVNPNRPDAMSVAGVARDLAARLGVPFAIPEPVVVDDGRAVSDLASVEIIDPELCGRFVVRVLGDVCVGQSPPWLANRVRALGMRPINSVVDVSNYVMLELGQPNHTYDLDLVPNGRLGTRWAREGEVLVTLDSMERELNPDDGVIVDEADTVIGLAGVMGGASTEISETTESVLLEMAWWNPMAIARTSTRLGLRSEASMRFERGADIDAAALAAARFAQLLGEAGATVASGEVDERGDQPDRSPVRVRTSRVNSLLGTGLTPGQISGYLDPIGFELAPTDDGFDVAVPTFRPDTETETDVIEEIARHHGYGNIAKTVPTSILIGQLTRRQLTRRELRQVLIGMGISEAMPLPFLAPTDLEHAGVMADGVVVTNPLDTEESVLRTSLRPGLLKALAFNESHRQDGVRLFEIGKVFERSEGANPLPDEPELLAVALQGAEAPAVVDVWRAITDALGVAANEVIAAELPGLHPTRSAQLVVAGDTVGSIGEIDPTVAEVFGVAERVAWLEVDLDRLLASETTDKQYTSVSRQPSSDFDLAFEVADSVPAGEVEVTMRSAAGDLLAEIALFDVYRGEPIRPEHRSLAYQLRLQAPDRTLTDDQVAEVRQRVIGAVESAHGGVLRA